MNSYFNLQKINFVHNNNNNYTCYILYEFTGYRKLITFNIGINDGQIKHVYIDAFNNSFQIADNPLNITLDPHIFYLKLQRINNYIKILEIYNADYITDSVINYENLTFALLDNFYMLSGILLEDVQNLETLDISIKERLRAIYNQISNIYSSINNINQINNQQNNQINDIYSRLNNVDQINNQQNNQINDIYSRLNNIDQINNQQNNEISIHENNIYSLLDNFYMLGGLLLENIQNLETLDISIKEELREIYNQISDIHNLSLRLTYTEQVNIQQNNQINDIYSRLNNVDQINNQQNNDISRLNIFVEEINSSYFSNYIVTIESNIIITPELLGTLIYVMSNNKLYKCTTTGLEEIDWQKIIMTTQEYKLGRLRINNNALEISPNGTNWYRCFPLVGSKTFRIHTIDNTNYNYKYYLPPGATATIEHANHIPIVYAPNVIPMFYLQTYWFYNYGFWVGLRPSNIAISNGYGRFIAAAKNSNNIEEINTGSISNSSIIPFYEQSEIAENWGFVTLTISSIQRFHITSMCQGYNLNAIHSIMGHGTAPSTSYWLGTWYNDNGEQFSTNNVIIHRWR